MQNGRATRNTRIVGVSSVDARHQWNCSNSFLRPEVPRHPASPVGLLASAPDLVPGRETLTESLRIPLQPTWISWGRDIAVSWCNPKGSFAPPSDFESPLSTICEKQSTSTPPLARFLRYDDTYQYAQYIMLHTLMDSPFESRMNLLSTPLFHLTNLLSGESL